MKTGKDSISKQTVLITGAAGGLGKAFAMECARRGWDLFLTDQPGHSLENLARILESTNHTTVHTFACDLAEPGSYSLLLGELQQKHTTITMLINVAGIDFEGLFIHQTLQDLQTMVRLNVEGPLALMHEVIAFRDPQQPFRIVNVSSMAAFYPMPVKATYAASKRFLLDLSRALNLEYKSQNASVTALCPAGMPTNTQCIQSIHAQGWIGYVTTLDTGRVAYETIKAALKGRSIVVPGMVNRLVNLIGSLVPVSLKMKLIAERWTSVRSKRVSLGEVGQI